MAEAPLVSVVVPAFNAQDTVVEAVESLLAQSYGPIEIIVVDDGSSDATREHLGPYSDQIVVLERPHQGLSEARNAGHRIAQGDYVAWLDADDVALPGRIEAQVAVLQSRPDVVLVSTNFSTFGSEGQIESAALVTNYSTLQARGGLSVLYGPPARDICPFPVHVGRILEELAFGNFVHPPTVMMRREAMRRAGDLVSLYPVANDWLFFLSLARQGPFACIDADLIRYRRSPGQITSVDSNRLKIARDNLGALNRVEEWHADLLESDPKRLRRVKAERHLDLADALAESTTAAALAEAIRSAGFGMPPGSLWRTVAKAVLPSGFLRRYRARRNSFGT